VTIHVLGTNDPGDVFHIPLAMEALIGVVRAVPHLERYEPRGT